MTQRTFSLCQSTGDEDARESNMYRLLSINLFTVAFLVKMVYTDYILMLVLLVTAIHIQDARAT